MSFQGFAGDFADSAAYSDYNTLGNFSLFHSGPPICSNVPDIISSISQKVEIIPGGIEFKMGQPLTIRKMPAATLCCL